MKWNKEKSGGMISTDGTSIYINPDYFIKRTVEGAKSDLIHEVHHVAFNHMTRCKAAGLDKIKYNIAADYFINLLMLDSGYEIDSTFIIDEKYRGMSVKAIYDSLKDNDIPPDYSPDIMEGDGTAESKEMEIKEIISRAVIQAEQANDYDSIPANLRREISELLEDRKSVV